jgi:putative oxidoreductase
MLIYAHCAANIQQLSNIRKPETADWNQIMNYLSLGLRAVLTLAFVAAGGANLIGIDMMVNTFEAIGLGQWFRFVTGLIEVMGAILLWLPNKQVYGASILGGTMVGAVFTHWFILGPSAVPAIVLGLICAAVLYLYREQIPAALGQA